MPTCLPACLLCTTVWFSEDILLSDARLNRSCYVVHIDANLMNLKKGRFLKSSGYG